MRILKKSIIIIHVKIKQLLIPESMNKSGAIFDIEYLTHVRCEYRTPTDLSQNRNILHLIQ